MRKVSTREIRNVLPQLEEILAREGELVLTRRGKPVARLVPMADGRARPSHADLRARMTRSDRGSEIYVGQDRDDR